MKTWQEFYEEKWPESKRLSATYQHKTFQSGQFWTYQWVGTYGHPEYGECVFVPVTYPIANSTYILELVRDKKK